MEDVPEADGGTDFHLQGGWVPNMLGETPLHPKPWNPSQHPAQFGGPSWLILSPS